MFEIKGIPIAEMTIREPNISEILDSYFTILLYYEKKPK
jgi:hypothetical protein